MPAPDTDVTAVVENLVRDHGEPIIQAGLRGDLSQNTLDVAQDLTGALADEITAGRQLEADLADLDARRDLLPRDGFQRLVNDAKRDARNKLTAAERAADRAYDQLETRLLEDALPKFAPEREQLARDEAALALSNGDPETAAIDLALRGNDEALGALLSPWGRTLLKARGVRNPDALLKDVRAAARGRVIERADTPAAIALRDHLGPLGAAKGTAGHTARKHTRNLH